MASTWALWAVASLLCVWQALLTWMVLRTREDRDAGEETHRMARLASAMSDLTDRFEERLRDGLREIDGARREAPREPPPPAPLEPCITCGGSGIRHAAAEPEREERRIRAVGGTPRPWNRPRPVFGDFRRDRGF